ncbi:TetR/AcrR family transcriptional regulator [Thalassospira lohafexi]|uniref:TetR family transcriptional regulator n=1 Tax=Thalassospira lohafexi TaxID=744227 RepID=A0A2N3L1N6_9PROT|nr:TetR/AcrR family transcriptional regulator [Thalassospira lohafexi]PKR56724.1 TetR family transcriptional regulator [Thalassospira lohafexi]
MAKETPTEKKVATATSTTRSTNTTATKAPRTTRAPRADALRNEDALLEAAKVVFANIGVDAPVREIAAQAGVGVGTLYRRFPTRSDLVVGVFKREVDACAAEAPKLATAHPPGEALSRWLKRYCQFIVTKKGLASALHSGDPAFDALPAYFRSNFEPALTDLLAAAAKAGEARHDVDAYDLLRAIGNLASTGGKDGPDGMEHTYRMLDLMIDGLRFGTPR